MSPSGAETFNTGENEFATSFGEQLPATLGPSWLSNVSTTYAPLKFALSSKSIFT